MAMVIVDIKSIEVDLIESVKTSRDHLLAPMSLLSLGPYDILPELHFGLSGYPISLSLDGSSMSVFVVGGTDSCRAP